VRNVLNLLRACFQDAVERHIILANPAAGVHPPKRRADLRRAAEQARDAAVEAARKVLDDSRGIVWFATVTDLEAHIKSAIQTLEAALRGGGGG
ncbi:MAG: hypothetical protein WC683_03165, partial [bacterium]